MERGGSNVNGRNGPFDDSALLIASKFDQSQMVTFLLSKGAWVDMKNSVGQTALWSAVNVGNTDVAKILVTSGRANLDFLYGDVDPLTILHMASQRGNLELVRVLTDAGANVDARSQKFGDTPISAASFYGHLEVVRHLYLFGGANANTRNYQGFSPLYAAAQVVLSIQRKNP